MKIINGNRIPQYISVCGECRSTFVYQKSETDELDMVNFLGRVKCPVCGVENIIDYKPFEPCLQNDTMVASESCVGSNPACVSEPLS